MWSSNTNPQPLLGKSYFEYDANFFSFYRLFFVKYKKNLEKSIFFKGNEVLKL